MWFKNLQLYRLTAPLDVNDLPGLLAKQRFTPCSASEEETHGFVPPIDNGELVHVVNRQMLIMLRSQKKLLPANVVNEEVKKRSAEFEHQQGFRPGRKQTKEIKEQVITELLPKAFSQISDTRIWIDPIHAYMVIDTSSAARADIVFQYLLKALERLPVTTLRTETSPLTAMTNWLAADEAPAGFTIDQDIELRSANEGRACVRYVRHTPAAEDVQKQIASGKQCTRLAMTWDDRISFVLTDALTLKRVAPLDILKENAEMIANDAERFDTDFALMTGELAKLITGLVKALGGLEQPKKEAA